MLVGMWALRNFVHVFSSCLVCFEELFFPKWLRDKQSTNKKRHLFGLFHSLLHRTCVGYCINIYIYIYIYSLLKQFSLALNIN